MGIVLKSERELAKMRATGLIVRAVLDAVEAACVPGVTTAELNAIAERELRRARATSAFLGYAPGGAPPYPAVLCTSVNTVVVHGVPDRRQVLQEGDVVGIDFACSKDGYCADAARTVAVGVVSAPARALIAATQACLERAIRAAVPGARLGDLGAAIQGHAEALGYSVVREFVGHGIGRAMHEAPNVPNHGRAGSGLRLQAGMAIAIEPMLNAGGAAVRMLDDGWTVVTADASLSAHVEHTVAVTDDGPWILTAA
ncbi:MAG TPA: type I methionyl aminopeptidase [Polyangia bacterium]|nr:type I methionyl aminopeptidase [Polyangia bacterium]HVZ88846.1 type I methionyl aminopeptidase [Polyangia bacterium]